MTKWIVAAILAMFAAGCSGHGSQDGSGLTEAQRDSVLGTEKAVPGSGAIGRAQAAAGSERQHANDLNAAVDSLPK